MVGPHYSPKRRCCKWVIVGLPSETVKKGGGLEEPTHIVSSLTRLMCLGTKRPAESIARHGKKWAGRECLRRKLPIYITAETKCEESRIATHLLRPLRASLFRSDDVDAFAVDGNKDVPVFRIDSN